MLNLKILEIGNTYEQELKIRNEYLIRQLPISFQGLAENTEQMLRYDFWIIHNLFFKICQFFWIWDKKNHIMNQPPLFIFYLAPPPLSFRHTFGIQFISSHEIHHFVNSSIYLFINSSIYKFIHLSIHL